MPSRNRQCPCHKVSKQELQKIRCVKNAGCHDANENRNDLSKPIVNAADTFILPNTEYMDLLSVDALQNFGHYKIYCPRCKHIIDKAKRLAGNISKFNKNNVIRICDHCSKKVFETSREDSNKEVKQYISTKYQKYSKQHFKTILTKIRQLLKDIRVGETKVKKSRPHTYSDKNLLSMDHGPVTHRSHEPDLGEWAYTDNIKPGRARASKHDLPFSGYSAKRKTTPSDLNVLKPSTQKHVHLKSQDDLITDSVSWSIDNDDYIDSEEFCKVMVSTGGSKTHLPKRDLTAAKLHHKIIITGAGSKDTTPTSDFKEDSKTIRPVRDFISAKQRYKGTEDPRSPATASRFRLTKQFYKRKIMKEDAERILPNNKSDKHLIDLKCKVQPIVDQKLKSLHIPRDLHFRKSMSDVELEKVTGDISARKYNSAEALYSSASAIDDSLEKDFKYYFHKENDKIVKKPVRQISSPELIKNTLDILHARAEKERTKLEQDRRKKQEEKENKRIARENKINERLQIEEAKRIAKEKDKLEKELENQKEKQESSRKKGDTHLNDKESLVKFKDKKQSKVAAVQTSTQKIKTKHSKQNVSKDSEKKEDISSKEAQSDKNKKHKEDKDSGQLGKEKQKTDKEKEKNDKNIEGRGLKDTGDVKGKTKQEIKDKEFQKSREGITAKKDTDKVTEKDKDYIQKSKEGADVKKSVDQIKEKVNKDSKQTQTSKEIEQNIKKMKNTEKLNEDLHEKKDNEKNNKGAKETQASLKETRKSEENSKPSKKTKESEKPSKEENNKDVQQKTDSSAAQDFQKLLAEQAKLKEADQKQKKIREEEERKAREAADKLKLETPESKAKKIEEKKSERKSFSQTNPKNANKEDNNKDISFSKIKMKEPSTDDLIWELVRLKQAGSKGTGKEISNTKLKNLIVKHRAHKNMNLDHCIICHDSDIELDLESLENRNQLDTKFADIIIGENIFKFKIPFKERQSEEEKEVVPILFKSVYENEVNEMNDRKNDILLPSVPIEPEKKVPKPGKETKTTEQDVAKGVIRYALSNRAFIDKGWTLLPTEKVVRKMNVYRMRPAHPEFDWFEHNKSKGLMLYDSGEKLAEFDDKGRGRWFYRSGKLALNYYDAEESNAQQRFVIYSSGEPDERGRSRPFTILATFDYLGNGIVFDHAGKIRLKYNQTEGVILDRSLGPVSHWKWHTLNDPPVLQQVMIDTQMSYKDPDILKLGGPGDKKLRPDNEEMLAIEFDNFIKEKSKKLTQTFKPFQIKMKALKINEQFSLKVLDQATIYLIFSDGSTNLKLNLGMILDHKEIVDTDTAEVGEVSNNVERLPARTTSVAELQIGLTRAQHIEKLRVDRERRLRPPVPSASADRLTAAMSRPLRQPFRTASSTSTTTVSQICKCKKPSSNNVYYDNRLI